MHKKVEEFLAKREKREQAQQLVYCDLVKEYAGLVSDEEDFVEVTKQEYDKFFFHPSLRVEDKGHYYVKKRMPLEITDEEFDAVEAAIPPEVLSELRLKATGVYNETNAESWAGKFFTIIAWVLWICGFIISIVGANVTREVSGYYSTRIIKEFSFQAFMSIFIIYFISGCFSLCAAELFKKLQQIVNLLNKK